MQTNRNTTTAALPRTATAEFVTSCRAGTTTSNEEKSVTLM